MSSANSERLINLPESEQANMILIVYAAGSARKMALITGRQILYRLGKDSPVCYLLDCALRCTRFIFLGVLEEDLNIGRSQTAGNRA